MDTTPFWRSYVAQRNFIRSAKSPSAFDIEFHSTYTLEPNRIIGLYNPINDEDWVRGSELDVSNDGTIVIYSPDSKTEYSMEEHNIAQATPAYGFKADGLVHRAHAPLDVRYDFVKSHKEIGSNLAYASLRQNRILIHGIRDLQEDESSGFTELRDPTCTGDENEPCPPTCTVQMGTRWCKMMHYKVNRGLHIYLYSAPSGRYNSLPDFVVNQIVPAINSSKVTHVNTFNDAGDRFGLSLIAKNIEKPILVNAYVSDIKDLPSDSKSLLRGRWNIFPIRNMHSQRGIAELEELPGGQIFFATLTADEIEEHEESFFAIAKKHCHSYLSLVSGLDESNCDLLFFMESLAKNYNYGGTILIVSDRHVIVPKGHLQDGVLEELCFDEATTYRRITTFLLFRSKSDHFCEGGINARMEEAFESGIESPPDFLPLMFGSTTNVPRSRNDPIPPVTLGLNMAVSQLMSEALRADFALTRIKQLAAIISKDTTNCRYVDNLITLHFESRSSTHVFIHGANNADTPGDANTHWSACDLSGYDFSNRKITGTERHDVTPYYSEVARFVSLGRVVPCRSLPIPCPESAGPSSNSVTSP